MNVASVRETVNFTNKTNAVTPYTLGQVLDSYATQAYVASAIATATIDPSQIDLSAYAKTTDLPTKLSQLTNDDNYVQTVSGLIPSSVLPSYVDDVLEYSSQSAFPNPGESGKIYVAKDTDLTYRWSGTGYVEISKSLALGTTSTTAFRGDYGNTAYQHSQATGNPHSLSLTDLSISVSATEINYLNSLNENIMTALGKKLNLSGGTLTGYITLHHAPTDNMHAANKKYVDDEISGISVRVSQNVTNISNLTQDLGTLSTTVGTQAETLTEVQNSITGINQTTAAHTSAISTLESTASGLTSSVSTLNNSVTTINATINHLNMELSSDNIVVQVNSDNKPLADRTYEIDCDIKFRGGDITPDSVSLSPSSITGITYSYSNKKISVTVDDATAIPNSFNRITATCTYTYQTIAFTNVKTLDVLTIPRGANGSSGTSVTITATDVAYQASDSGTEEPSGEWLESPPSVNPGNYLWTRTTVTYSTGDSTESFSVAYVGTNGTDGQDGADGQDGTNAYTHIRYSENSDGTDFSDTPSSTRIYMGVYNGTSSTAPSDKTAYTWSKYKGDNGTNGNGINSITYYYKATSTQSKPQASAITSTTIPELDGTNNKFLWQKEVIDYTSATDKTTVTLIGVYGDKGNTGPAGADGADGQDGADGSKWSQGIALTGTTGSITGVAGAVGDQYLNSSTGNTYTCVTAGTSSTAIWNYSGNIKGADGQDAAVKSDTAPSDTTKLWLDTETNTLKQYSSDSSEWVVVNDYSGQIQDAIDQAERFANAAEEAGKDAAQAAYDNVVADYSLASVKQQSEYSYSYLNQNAGRFELTVGCMLSDDWFLGTKITGTPSTATKYTDSEVPYAYVGNIYMNTETYNTYKCVTEGDPTDAEWVFDGNVKGAITRLQKDSESYFNFTDSGLFIGAKDSSYRLQLKNDKIVMLFGTSDIAWWDTVSFHTDHTVTKALTIENTVIEEVNNTPVTKTYKFGFVGNSNGSVSFRKVGEITWAE